MFSRNRLRLFPSQLDGATVKGKIYVYLDPDGLDDIESVTFRLDPARGRKIVKHVERYAPYDLLGTKRWNRPVPLRIEGRYIGINELTVTIERSNGSTIVLETTFTGARYQPRRHR